MRLKLVGFFRELEHGEPDGPSLRDCVREEGHPEERREIQYLKAGATLATTGAMTDDVLNPSRAKVAVLAVMTDGEWAWPADLAYYVENYHVALPEEFLNHMRKLDWRPPSLTHDDLVTITEEHFGGTGSTS